MDVMYCILKKMYQNFEILLEDIKDQVQFKEQECKVICIFYLVMKLVMSVMLGDLDKWVMFDVVMEVIIDDVANKVGEMECFMEMFFNVMNFIDLQQGIFEDEGLKMFE